MTEEAQCVLGSQLNPIIHPQEVEDLRFQQSRVRRRSSFLNSSSSKMARPHQWSKYLVERRDRETAWRFQVKGYFVVRSQSRYQDIFPKRLGGNLDRYI